MTNNERFLIFRIIPDMRPEELIDSFSMSQNKYWYVTPADEITESIIEAKRIIFNDYVLKSINSNGFVNITRTTIFQTYKKHHEIAKKNFHSNLKSKSFRIEPIFVYFSVSVEPALVTCPEVKNVIKEGIISELSHTEIDMVRGYL